MLCPEYVVYVEKFRANWHLFSSDKTHTVDLGVTDTVRDVKAVVEARQGKVWSLYGSVICFTTVACKS